ncbi:hypothetical protein C4K68_08705 [Pokkaliibacter plantistimulans]|uniref:PilX/PilW C-terminal domain-containing protein n=1 Tax=Proteobacteria bacterium 228 TaxID=2083153 RepID=A0A2S5KSK4_9PROT|nr:hypothetical protein [Pokkaliibacter plantistimulans]PPC77738.1 hypothetical protein C4K68_08705 [Pokkaliibacter plantistimulans]
MTTPRVLTHNLRAGRQRGAALLVCIVMMALLMVIGISAYRMTNLTQKMETNAEDTQLAGILAESSLQEAESYISSDNAILTTKLGHGKYNVSDSDTPKWKVVTGTQSGNQNVWETTDAVLTYSQSVQDIDNRLRTTPVYIIEELPEPEQFKIENSQVEGHGLRERMELYRITAKGTGPSQELDRYLQSNYTRIVTK